MYRILAYMFYSRHSSPIVLPSHSFIQSQRNVTAAVMNASNVAVQLRPGKLKCLVHLDSEAVQIVTGRDLFRDPSLISKLEQEFSESSCYRYPIVNLSPSVKTLYTTLEQECEFSPKEEILAQSARVMPSATSKTEGRGEQLRGYSGINPTQQER